VRAGRTGRLLGAEGGGGADPRGSDSSGDISLTFTKVPWRVKVTDSFGSITLVLPPPGAAAFRGETRTSFGSATVTVPQSPSARNVITASDNAGDIRIVTQHPPATPASSVAP
jgi:hypothetical protein